MFMPTAHWWWACAVIQREGSTLQDPQSKLKKPGFSSSEFLLLLRKHCFPGKNRCGMARASARVMLGDCVTGILAL